MRLANLPKRQFSSEKARATLDDSTRASAIALHACVHADSSFVIFVCFCFERLVILVDSSLRVYDRAGNPKLVEGSTCECSCLPISWASLPWRRAMHIRGE